MGFYVINENEEAMIPFYFNHEIQADDYRQRHCRGKEWEVVHTRINDMGFDVV